jgi:hypothetical protein
MEFRIPVQTSTSAWEINHLNLERFYKLFEKLVVQNLIWRHKIKPCLIIRDMLVVMIAKNWNSSERLN